MKAADELMSALELGAREVYWRSPALQRWYARHRSQRSRAAVLSRSRLREHLLDAGLDQHEVVLVHSSVQSFAFADEDGMATVASPLGVAAQLLADLKCLVGPSRTLVMPSHPRYVADPGFMRDKSGLVFDYSPAATPSRVGLVTEFFRSLPGVLRSAHPLSSVAALGPAAGKLVENNLNSHQPLPHGIHSSYYRICQLRGLVVSIGVPLIKCLTVMHVAEEVRDDEWPVPNFFYERRFRVSLHGETREWTVRERRPHFVRALLLGQVRRDLLREGVLHETSVDGVRVDTACASDVLDFMAHHPHPTYPYSRMLAVG